jgi:hypothetical protein
MCDLPVEITDEEQIVRAIFFPHHIDISKNRLKPAAFRSPPDKDEVSVIRHTYMGSDFCKAKAKEIAQRSPMVTYVGLAALRARDIRATGSTIDDSREVYYGHAHISHGVVLPRDEPLNSALNMVVIERCRALVAITHYYADPNPAADLWLGGTIQP